jgi:hypothetical protein
MIAVLIFLIGLKVAVPLLRIPRLLVKSISMTTDPQSDKELDSDYKKNKEYYSNYNSISQHFLWYTEVPYFSSYTIDYISAHYYKITTPPPDFSLRSIV